MISQIPEIVDTPVVTCKCGACGHEFLVAWEFRTLYVYCIKCGKRVEP